MISSQTFSTIFSVGSSLLLSYAVAAGVSLFIIRLIGTGQRETILKGITMTKDLEISGVEAFYDKESGTITLTDDSHDVVRIDRADIATLLDFLAGCYEKEQERGLT